MSRGLLISFEGGEGCGKSTQISMLAARLESAGVRTRCLREPGGTRVGEAVRAILLDPDNSELDARAELLLYESARAQLVAEVIEPALEAGEVVLLDRYFDSSSAYQGYGRGLPLDEVAALNAAATGGLMPDRTLLLDLEVAEGVRRATAGGADRLEGESVAFHERVRAGFLALAAGERERWRVIDASGSPAEVAERVAHALRGLGLPGLAE
jgi:dTMP kinase